MNDGRRMIRDGVRGSPGSSEKESPSEKAGDIGTASDAIPFFGVAGDTKQYLLHQLTSDVAMPQETTTYFV